MASDYPYALATGRVQILFDKIRSVGVPAKANDAWLNQIGLTSSNDRRLKNVLKFIGFTDQAGTPTDLWKAYRGPNAAQVMAQAITDGYSALFHMYPDANLRPDNEIASVVRASTGFGNDTVKAIVATFKALVTLADFNAVHSGASAGTGRDGKGTGTERDSASKSGKRAPQDGWGTGPRLALNVNLQLTLPESKDPAVYDALFFSMRKHLLTELDGDE